MKTHSNMKRDFLTMSKFHMLHSTGKSGSYYLRHLKDNAPNEMWKHDPNNDNDKIRVAYQHQIHKYIQAFSSAEHSKELYKALDRWNLSKLAPETFLPLLSQVQ